MTQLTDLRIAGWKSIRDAQIDLRSLNILIGANGAGKSNLVSFFKLISEMMVDRLQIHVGTVGGAESLLHYGVKRTKVIDARFRFTTEGVENSYFIRWVPTAENSLLFATETLGPKAWDIIESFHPRMEQDRNDASRIGEGHRESVIKQVDQSELSVSSLGIAVKGLRSASIWRSASGSTRPARIALILTIG